MEPPHHEAALRAGGQGFGEGHGGWPEPAGRACGEATEFRQEGGEGRCAEAAGDQFFEQTPRPDAVCRVAPAGLEPSLEAEARQDLAVGRHIDHHVQPIGQGGQPCGLATKDGCGLGVSQGVEDAAIENGWNAAEAEALRQAGPGDHDADLEDARALAGRQGEAADRCGPPRVGRAARESVEPVENAGCEGLGCDTIRRAKEEVGGCGSLTSGAKVEFEP